MPLQRNALTMAGPGGVALDDLGLTTPAAPEPGAWFLGPKGENLEVMRELLCAALEAHADARATFSRRDPRFISEAAQKDEPYLETVATLRENLARLDRALRASTPMSSYRNKSHMNWDITMPGALGYFSAMMFNANNVALEAAPVTTLLELKVGHDLAHMLGFGATGTPPPWGHITCDGSVANAEAMWAARALRYQGAALARAIRLEDRLSDARALSVRTAQGDWARLLDLEPWELVNLPNDEILDLPRRLIEDTGLSEGDVRFALASYSLNALGMVAFHAEVLQGLAPPCVIAPATAHYSWDKAVTILGLGARALRHVTVDLDARLSIPHLRRILDDCVASRVPVMQVVAVAGSTAESAVDPVAAIVDLREEYAAQGLVFDLHVDAAWGGYFTSMLRRAPDGRNDTPIEPLSDHVARHLDALRHADSVTLDPHKSGYVPYPAGALCYRDERMINLVAHTSPVVFHDDDAPSIGVYGLEGSKPGAAAAGVALSHQIIPLDQSGYGWLLGRCIFNAKRFYVGVNTLAERDDPFFAIPVTRLPSERRGAEPAEIAVEREAMRELRDMSNERLRSLLMERDDLAELFRDLGPDLTVFAYAFNFLDDDGRVNDSLTAMNRLNEKLFQRMSVEKIEIEDEPPERDLIVTSSVFPAATYGTEMIGDFCRRAQVASGDEVRVLISTLQDPWVTDTVEGNFLGTLFKALKNEVLAARQELLDEMKE